MSISSSDSNARAARGSARAGGVIVARVRGEGDPELLHLPERDAGPAEDREAAEEPRERPHQVERRNDVARHRLRADGLHPRQLEEDQPDQPEEEHLVPVLRGDEPELGRDIVPAAGGCGPLDVQHVAAAAGAVQLQLLDALRERAEMLEEPVLVLARGAQVAEPVPDEEPVRDGADHAGREHPEEHGEREPREIGRSTQEDREIDGEDGDAERRLGDLQDVLGQRRREPRGAQLLDLAQRHGQDAGDQVAPQARRRLLGVAGEAQLREHVGRDPSRSQHAEGDDQGRARAAMPVERGVDERDQAGAARAAQDRGKRGPDHHRR